MIYTHVIKDLRRPALSPLDRFRAEKAAKRAESGRRKLPAEG
jgi:hypothetical protein